jgi:amino acid transporter
VPTFLARVSVKSGVPYASIALQAVLAMGYTLVAPLDRLAAYTVLGTGFFIVASALGFLWLRPRGSGGHGHPERGARRIFETIAALVVAGAYAWFIVFLVIEDPRTAAVGMGLILIGVVPFFLLRLARARRTTEDTEAHRGDG